MSAELSILVTAKNQSSAIFNQVKKDANDLGGSVTKLGSTMSNALKVGAVAGAGALVAAGVAAKGFAARASDLNESLSKSRVVFGENSKEIEKWAASAAKNIGQSKQEALEAAGTFGNLFTALGLTGDQSKKMSMDVVGLSADLASFNNIAGSEALEKLRAGLVGEAEPLRTLGVNINAATTEAKALEMGFQKVNGTFTESEKVQARYALILEQTKLAQGDFARTADGMANKQRILNAQWKDLQARLGQFVLPVMSLFVGLMSDKVLPVLEASADAIGNFANTIKNGLAGNVAEAAAAFNELPAPLQALALWLNEHRPQIEGLIQNIKDLVPVVRSLAMDALQGWVTILTALQPKLVEFGKWIAEHKAVAIALAVALGAVVIALIGWPAVFAAAVVGVGLLTTKIQEWRKENELLDGTLDGITITAYRFADAIRLVTTALSALITPIAENKYAMAALGIATAVMLLPLTALVATFYAIGRAADIASAVINAFQTALSGAYDVVVYVGAAILNWFADLGNKIAAAIPDPIHLLYDIGKDILSGLWAGLEEKWHDLEEWIGGIGGKIGDAFKGALKVNSPSLIMVPIGASVIEGLQVGMEQQSGSLFSQIDNIVAQVASRIAAAQASVAHAGASVEQGSAAPVGERTMGRERPTRVEGRTRDEWKWIFGASGIPASEYNVRLREMFGYAWGGYVPRDGMAWLHRGERVQTANEVRDGKGGGPVVQHITVHQLVVQGDPVAGLQALGVNI